LMHGAGISKKTWHSFRQGRASNDRHDRALRRASCFRINDGGAEGDRSWRGTPRRFHHGIRKKFAEYQGMRHAVTNSYGLMAFYYILKALDIPRDSEIIFPALTFWVVPEMARVFQTRCSVAEGTAHTLQLPVYASLTEKDLNRIIRVIREA